MGNIIKRVFRAIAVSYIVKAIKNLISKKINQPLYIINHKNTE
ncbi:Uncharacterised protein [Staphylococcus gallinarum]|uniref:Uncharacterized protein n=1 Tax=Staphylococcus gallinarum TaxID=1293 RepID=A0A380FEM4_STAGA|nr:Uncharacterised protein [Staphylococcus gallinarum]